LSHQELRRDPAMIEFTAFRSCDTSDDAITALQVHPLHFLGVAMAGWVNQHQCDINQ